MTSSSRWILRGLVVLVSGTALASCAARGQNRLLPITSAPAEAYDCVLYELARADFTITDTDRASGFVRALRMDRRLLDDPVRLEIHATLIPGPDGSDDLLQISSNARANDEADALAAACVPANGSQRGT